LRWIKTKDYFQDGLDLKCVLTTKSDAQTREQRFDQVITDVNEFTADNYVFLESMASCHSITRIHGELAGDPLDCKMFEFSKWELVEPSQEETKLFDMLVPTIVYPNGRFNANGVRA
jgi:cation-transporting ATPase 13A2